MARYYHPNHGVFLSVDPLLGNDDRVGMHNGYSYVDNSPTMKIDNDERIGGIIRLVFSGVRGLAKIVVKMSKKASKLATKGKN